MILDINPTSNIPEGLKISISFIYLEAITTLALVPTKQNKNFADEQSKHINNYKEKYHNNTNELTNAVIT